MGEQKKVKDFKYKGRRCVVIYIKRDLPNISREFLEGTSGFTPYCNGYVEIKDDEFKEDCDDYKISSDEITYQGMLEFSGGFGCGDGKHYIGFDSAHYWNDEKPESKTADYVANICKKIVDELEEQKDKYEKDNQRED